MSTGADAMGVAAWLTPVLIVAVAAGLAHPAMGQPARPADQATVDPPELIDPDCYPVEAEKADPLLVEEPDGVCPPDEPPPPGDGPASEPGPETDPPQTDPGPADPKAPPPGELQVSPPPSQQAPVQESTPAPVEPTTRAPRKSREGRRPSRAQPRRSAPDGRTRTHTDRSAQTHGDRPAQTPPRRSAQTQADRPAQTQARRSAPTQAQRYPQPSPLARFPRGSLETTEPLPPAERLEPRFARRLERVAERFRVPWGLMLAVRRARGHDGAVPASSQRLRILADRLVRLGARKYPRRAVRRLARAIAHRAAVERSKTVRRHALVRRVVALAHLNRAIGVRGLVRGLNRVKARLARQLLDSRRMIIYAGGRADIGTGFTDVRVLVLLRYLSSRYREVTVSSLTTGHGFFTASGNVSAHSYGQAVDIAALNGKPIRGNQESGGLTERALHHIMLLPGRLEPSELISLFELGGPSFALADHADHIHAGY
jgi:hypothetical protein